MTEQKMAELADELLSCPFCGGKASYRGSGVPLIFCESDDCFGPRTTAGNFDDAAAQWNTRTVAAQPVAWGERINGKIVSVRLDQSVHCTEPVYAAVPAAQPDGVREALTEIANRASNFADDDAAEWLPSIYRLACEYIGRDPMPLLEATGFSGRPETWPSRKAHPAVDGDRREAVIEECAKVAERFGIGRQRASYGGSDIAKAIRSLATQPPKDGASDSGDEQSAESVR